MAGEGGLGWRSQSESHYIFLGRRAELNQDGSRAESARTPLVLLLIVTQGICEENYERKGINERMRKMSYSILPLPKSSWVSLSNIITATFN